MKKTMLWSTLFTLICTQLHAETTPQTTQTQPAQPTNGAVTTEQTPATTPTTPTNQQNQNVQPQSTQTTPATTQQPVENEQTQPAQTTPVEQQTPPVINCDYKIPADVKIIDQSIILTWSEKAVTQAFDFEPANFDTQLQKLQNCFTAPGWEGFNSALQKSGNIDAIKVQNLTVSSQLDGTPQITASSASEWKVSLPLQVVYQNDKEKVTQLLTVNLAIGRKVSGDLGINQMVATPRVTTNMQSIDNTNAGTQNTTTSNPGTQPVPANNDVNQQNQTPGTTTNPGSSN